MATATAAVKKEEEEKEEEKVGANSRFRNPIQKRVLLM